jgi:hypothetical protein
MTKRLLGFAAGTVLVAGISAGLWWRIPARHPGTAKSGLDFPSKPELSAGQNRPGVVVPSPATAGAPAVAADNLLQRVAVDLLGGTPSRNRSALAGVHAQLAGLPRPAAAQQLLAFLQSGTDAGTGLPFAVGRGGQLSAAPTLRVAALDWLGEFDPAAAAEAARQILANSNSADEWAVALRNYYRQNQPADTYFVAQVEAAFSRADWLRNPSAGFAESLDFPVAIGGSEGFGILQGLLQKSPAMRWATLAAMDAWVIGGRATAIPLLAGTTTTAAALDAGSQAALLSRADIRDDDQRAAIESYLSTSSVPDTAKAEFLRQFPNQNMMVASHLVTTSRPMTLQDSARLDLAALQWVDDLMQKGTHPELSQALAASHDRLTGFVASAKRGGQL